MKDVLIVILITASVWMFGFSYGRWCNRGWILKSDVRNAFKDVSWKRQTFIYSGVQIIDSDGNTHFYPAKEIDSAIDKLNEKL